MIDLGKNSNTNNNTTKRVEIAIAKFKECLHPSQCEVLDMIIEYVELRTKAEVIKTIRSTMI